MRRFLAATLSPLILSACASASDHRSDLVDSSWTFTAIDGDAPVSEKARLTFEGDRIGANVGCNGMGGPWRLEGGRLIAGPLVQTQMYCEGPVWDQEKAVGALLAAAPKFGVNGDVMTIESGGHSAELRRE
ncbi:MAG: META domain-containing protein [Novosphingobium sp.]|nr:META domain-containing protein [Novosphingobium sp.]